MRNRLFIVLLLLTGTSSTLLAQSGRIVTPFTPRTTDSLGRKVYVQPQQKRNSPLAVTASWGYSPVSAINSFANNRLPFVYSGSTRDGGNITSTTGAISVGVSYEFTPWLEMNIPFIYTHSKGVQTFTPPSGASVQEGYLKDDWFLLLPNVRINWIRNNWLSVYSRAGIGMGIGKRWRYTVNTDDQTKCIFAWQASPVGLEFGTGALCFFVEGGYGYSGAAIAGIKLKVGKVDKDGRTSTGRKVEWYEKYMR